MARQAQEWTDFYEAVWNRRLQLFQQLEQEGCKDPLAIIKKFSIFSLHVAMGMTPAGEWVEQGVDYARYGERYPLTGVPVGEERVFLNTPYYAPFYESVNQLLVDHILMGNYDAVVELGAGFGKNLIEIWYSGGPQNISYYAGEYTESGLHSIEYLSSLKPEMKLSAFHFDHKAPDLSPVKGGHVFVFTCHSIEQVTELPEDYFKKIAESFDSVTCVHLEPFGFQVGPNTDHITQAQQEMFEVNCWNQNFLQVYQGSVDRGEIIPVFHGKNIVPSVQANNPTSLVIWTKPRVA